MGTTMGPCGREHVDDEMGRGLMLKYTTHPQPHKQLMVGWIVGGSTMMMTKGGVDDAATNEERGDHSERTEQNKGPRDVNDISWVLFLLFLFHFHFTNNLLRY
jgi:hypothetical protein